MTKYTLDIKIDSAGLKQIQGETISIAKTVTTALVGGNLATAWISFDPAQHITVTWTEDYYIYASSSAAQGGATIDLSSYTDAAVQADQLYTYGTASTFSNAKANTGGAFETNNLQQSPNPWTMGLAQEATVGGKSTMAALNAVKVPYNQTASFTPIENISIWVSSIQNNGVVLSQIANTALPVQLTSQKSTANLGFDDSLNVFTFNNYS
ncbi:MAG: hypothetical protein ABJN98_15910 [Roseibium sp.]